MRILFVGNEEEYRKALDGREDGSPLSLFYFPRFCPGSATAAFDAILVPALKFLAWPAETHPIPVIACGSAGVALECFDAGCADFIREPFSGEELYARVSAKTNRRLEVASSGVVAEGGRIYGPSSSARLNESAYGILALLKNNGCRPVPREAIAAILGISPKSSRAIDMRISRLRMTLREIGAGALADTIRCENGSYRLSR
jgi:DNA-binding response OmpR family regulator